MSDLYSNLDGMEKDEIYRRLLSHVVKSEEEIEEQEHRSGSSTDLNVYLLDNRGVQTGEIQRKIDCLVSKNHTENGAYDEGTQNDVDTLLYESEITGHAKKFFEDHPISEKRVSDDVSVIGVDTVEKNRTDKSVWVHQEGYIWVFTTERNEWRKNIENLIKYLPDVDRLYLSTDDLREIMTDDSIPDSFVSGFTAKYHAPYADREATLRFHGGTKEDLDDAKEIFNAKPTRIEFDQTNSPESAIQAAGTNQARCTFRSIKSGSVDKAVDTLMSVSEMYQDRDKESYAIPADIGMETSERGISAGEFTAIELTNSDRNQNETENSLIEEIKSKVINGNNYRHTHRSDNTLRIWDQNHQEIFDLAVEAPDIVIYPKSSTTAMSIRDIISEIFEFDSTYDQTKIEQKVSTET